MAHYKSLHKKKKLAKKGSQTKWAPFWLVFKIAGKGKKVHPSRFTTVKRHWKRSRTNVT
ncbi:MAG TPA: hypothetical protein HA282_01665 [Nanoarchaeota archaeon]|nr:MAG: hypothetical protein QT01_C0002G0041 [archaeon GW2011_AR6]MBS3083164.1 hypothetical protein [Candidatus Pacearchaeota archaeon]HIH18260.1 hypothetical protein [Nanoarchaeota archaeon]HIH34275.1 hypothetical protein [Nanoarchaeota archaeon]HIH50867.1 hypothetical protein [Nanoarchaeota archaeon]